MLFTSALSEPLIVSSEHYDITILVGSGGEGMCRGSAVAVVHHFLITGERERQGLHNCNSVSFI